MSTTSFTGFLEQAQARLGVDGAAPAPAPAAAMEVDEQPVVPVVTGLPVLPEAMANEALPEAMAVADPASWEVSLEDFQDVVDDDCGVPEGVTTDRSSKSSMKNMRSGTGIQASSEESRRKRGFARAAGPNGKSGKYLTKQGRGRSKKEDGATPSEEATATLENDGGGILPPYSVRQTMLRFFLNVARYSEFPAGMERRAVFYFNNDATFRWYDDKNREHIWSWTRRKQKSSDKTICDMLQVPRVYNDKQGCFNLEQGCALAYLSEPDERLACDTEGYVKKKTCDDIRAKYNRQKEAAAAEFCAEFCPGEEKPDKGGWRDVARNKGWRMRQAFEAKIKAAATPLTWAKMYELHPDCEPNQSVDAALKNAETRNPGVVSTAARPGFRPKQGLKRQVAALAVLPAVEPEGQMEPLQANNPGVSFAAEPSVDEASLVRAEVPSEARPRKKRKREKRAPTAPQEAPPLPQDWDLLLDEEGAYHAVRDALEQEVGNNVLLPLGLAYRRFTQAETAASTAQQKVDTAEAMGNAPDKWKKYVKKDKKAKDDELEAAKEKLWNLLDAAQQKQNLARMALHAAYDELMKACDSDEEQEEQGGEPLSEEDLEAVEAVMVEAEDATGNPKFVDERVGRPGPVGKPYRAMGCSFSSEDAKRTGWDGPSFE